MSESDELCNQKAKYKLEPLRRNDKFPAGLSSSSSRERFRYGLVLCLEPLGTYKTARTWAYPFSPQYSRVPVPTVGLPFDTTKPRRGRWREILGTKISDSSEPIEPHWSEGLSRRVREIKEIEEARADLQKRVEICLYGKPRDPPIPPVCPDDVYGQATDSKTKSQQPSNSRGDCCLPRQRDRCSRRPMPHCLKQLADKFVGNTEHTAKPPPSPVRLPVLPTPYEGRGGQEYEFRYDDGLSAKLGVRKIPLLMIPEGAKYGNCVFRNPPIGYDRPVRTKPRPVQPWWPPVMRKPVFFEKPHPKPRYIGLHCDPTYLMPPEVVLKNF